ncbi:LysR family transcriptional regulator [Azospirillum canadense]|uniref:LysR family transcriptional regulator n=1 Tax=Azospirillum canadense TaxID=403962 RepID=UPI002226B388|nr:LysR family transcriptional regulator [Azospirillum canadense]MCW2242020.1 DNA-binding transcriptional LysR family regulator [Azospirillum canadense]
MNVDALRHFIAIVEAGSIRDAADNLHIAQSALSRQVQHLEQLFGARLLSRLPRGVEPTEAGRIVLRHARATVDQLRNARDEIAAMEGLKTGIVRVAVIEPIADGFLPDCIARFHHSHPGVSFDVRVGSTRQVVALVREGIAELGLAYNPPREDGIVQRASARQPLVALVNPRHRLTASDAVALAELTDWPVILPPAGSPTRVLIEEAARRSGVALRPALLESDSVALRLALAQRTDAVAILARLSAPKSSASGGLRMLPMRDDLLTSGRVEMLAAEGRHLSNATLRFERLLRSSLKAAEDRP